MNQSGYRIADAARGRWRDIFRAVGLSERQVSGHHAPCPLCADGGGKDRFRMDDKRGEGTWICNRCGAGTGVDLVMKYRSSDFMAAKIEIERHIGVSKFSAPKAAVTSDEGARRAETGWGYTSELTGSDPASLWLAKRGLRPMIYPPCLRWSDATAYKAQDGMITKHPTMAAKFQAADGATFALHRTYLTHDGGRAFADEIRKFSPGPVPEGGAVRLAPAAESMGVATGIETSLSAMRIFRLPVWALLNDRVMLKWRPPSVARHIIVLGDNDESYSGQMAAYGLAFVLKQKGFDVEVRIPDCTGQDWNDVDMADQGISPPSFQKERSYGNAASDEFEHIGGWL